MIISLSDEQGLKRCKIIRFMFHDSETKNWGYVYADPRDIGTLQKLMTPNEIRGLNNVVSRMDATAPRAANYPHEWEKGQKKYVYGPCPARVDTGLETILVNKSDSIKASWRCV